MKKHLENFDVEVLYHINSPSGEQIGPLDDYPEKLLHDGFHHAYLIVKQNGKLGIINENAELIYPIVAKSIKQLCYYSLKYYSVFSELPLVFIDSQLYNLRQKTFILGGRHYYGHAYATDNCLIFSELNLIQLDTRYLENEVFSGHSLKKPLYGFYDLISGERVIDDLVTEVKDTKRLKYCLEATKMTPDGKSHGFIFLDHKKSIWFGKKIPEVYRLDDLYEFFKTRDFVYSGGKIPHFVDRTLYFTFLHHPKKATTRKGDFIEYFKRYNLSPPTVKTEYTSVCNQNNVPLLLKKDGSALLLRWETIVINNEPCSYQGEILRWCTFNYRPSDGLTAAFEIIKYVKFGYAGGQDEPGTIYSFALFGEKVVVIIESGALAYPATLLRTTKIASKDEEWSCRRYIVDYNTGKFLSHDETLYQQAYQFFRKQD